MESAKLEQDAITAARIVPFDLAAFRTDDAACAALHAPVRNDFDLALLVLAVTAGRTGGDQRLQGLGWNIICPDLDMWPPGINHVPVLVQLFFDTVAHWCLPSAPGACESPTICQNPGQAALRPQTLDDLGFLSPFCLSVHTQPDLGGCAHDARIQVEQVPVFVQQCRDLPVLAHVLQNETAFETLAVFRQVGCRTGLPAALQPDDG